MNRISKVSLLIPWYPRHWRKTWGRGRLAIMLHIAMAAATPRMWPWLQCTRTPNPRSQTRCARYKAQANSSRRSCGLFTTTRTTSPLKLSAYSNLDSIPNKQYQKMPKSECVNQYVVPIITWTSDYEDLIVLPLLAATLSTNVFYFENGAILCHNKHTQLG